MMWADILNKPKQGAAFRLDRSHLQNVPVDYDDEVERKRTHPSLLPKGEWKGDSSDLVSGRSTATPTNHRSVLENKQKYKSKVPGRGTKPTGTKRKVKVTRGNRTAERLVPSRHTSFRIGDRIIAAT